MTALRCPAKLMTHSGRRENHHRWSNSPCIAPAYMINWHPEWINLVFLSLSWVCVRPTAIGFCLSYVFALFRWLLTLGFKGWLFGCLGFFLWHDSTAFLCDVWLIGVSPHVGGNALFHESVPLVFQQWDHDTLRDRRTFPIDYPVCPWGGLARQTPDDGNAKPPQSRNDRFIPLPLLLWAVALWFVEYGRYSLVSSDFFACNSPHFLFPTHLAIKFYNQLLQQLSAQVGGETSKGTHLFIALHRIG